MQQRLAAPRRAPPSTTCGPARRGGGSPTGARPTPSGSQHANSHSSTSAAACGRSSRSSGGPAGTIRQTTGGDVRHGPLPEPRVDRRAVARRRRDASRWRARRPTTRSASPRSCPTGPRATSPTTSRSATAQARFGAGAAEPEHVRMEQTWDTAVAVATGELNAAGGVRQRPHPAVRRPAAAARRAAGVRRARRRVHRRARADRVRLRTPSCPRCPRSRPTPSGSTADFAGQRLKRFVPITFTALKTAVPAPDAAYGAAARGGRSARQVPPRAVRADHVRRPPDAGRPAARRRQAVGQAARRPGPLRLRLDAARRCCSPSRAPRRGRVWCVVRGRRSDRLPSLDEGSSSVFGVAMIFVALRVLRRGVQRRPTVAAEVRGRFR